MKKVIIICLLVLISSTVEAQVWFQRSDLGGSGRHRGTSVAIGNKGYIGLGHFNGTGVNIVLKDWWQYDPATNSWSQKADFEGNSGNGNYGVATFGMQDKGYVVGGVFSSMETWKYIPSTNTWSREQDAPVSISNYIGFTIGSYGYTVIGTDVWAYNSTSETWEAKAVAPFNSSIWNSSFVIEGKGYLINGTSMYEYKPSIDQWISRASFPGMANAGRVAFNQAGKGYVITGYSGSLSNVVKENWEYDPSTNTWKQLEDFPGTSRRFSTGFTIGDRSYLGTGTNGTNFKDFWEFNALLSTGNLAKNIQIDVFPNPSTHQIKVALNNTKVQYRVYDINGRTLRTGSAIGEFTLQKDEFGAGFFLLDIFYDSKLLKQQKIEFR